MAQTRTYYRSFAGGEVSPEMFGRIDDVKFQTGAAKMLNFVALPQGPAENRPGTKFVLEVKDSTKRTRLIPFTFSTTQTVVIELGAGYFRFHTQGATILSGGVPYEVANPYAEADLFDIHYVQSADVLTLVHPNYAPRELTRVSATSWTLTTITFGASIATPAAPTVTATAGQGINITAITQANPGHITVANDAKNKTLAEGDSIYISGVGGMTQINNQFYIIDTFHAVDRFSVTNYQTGVKLNTTAFSAYTSGGIVQAMEQTQSVSNSYVITAVAANGIDETPASSPTSATNNLNVVGSYNTVSWVAITGAARYNVYKLQSGLYGYIGQSETTSFVDNNIAPDMGITPPIPETVFASTNNYPAAVSYFEQRRVFAGTNNAPQTMWMTRTSTESDMSYHIPLQDTDRINFRVAAREANTIRHLVPLTQFLALTSAAEWRISPVNSDVITPTTISVRPQSYIGANNVQPSIVNNTVVYCSARDGHVRELGYSWQASGFITGDLSLRSTHLFDGLDLVDMCYSKAPHPVLWFISSAGTMLGLTYIPEQQIAAWHQHDTDGAFESCTAVAEGAEDALYVIVARNIGGTVKRYVERFQTRQVDNLADCFFVDSGLTYDGTNTTAMTMTVTGGTTWGPADVLTVTSSPAVPFAATDVGDVIVLSGSDGTKYRITVTAINSSSVVQGVVDKVIPAALRGVPTTNWAWARGSVTGLSHLAGKVVSILADGSVMPQATVSASGGVTLQRPSTVIHVGLPYDSDLQTLPMTLQVEGFGQGRVKNVNEAWLRVYRSSGIFIGPSADKLVEAKQRTTEPYGSPPGLKTEEVGSKLTPTWQSAGSVYVRQSDPLPLTIVGLTLEVSIGE